jgi:nucleoid-associated protein YgaU
MPGPLQKLIITNDDTKEQSQVLFNPTEYSIEAAATWSDQTKRGQVPELQYAGGERKKLSMDLFFDTYEAKSDVRDHTVKVSNLLVFNREKHRPPKLTLSWGRAPRGGPFADLPFTCVLQSCKQQFTLFMSDGTPVRAKLSVVFIQFTLTEDELKKNQGNSADKTKTYLVKQGDTVSDIAGLFYKDPTQWRAIADANDIENPRELSTGSALTIPALE